MVLRFGFTGLPLPSRLTKLKPGISVTPALGTWANSILLSVKGPQGSERYPTKTWEREKKPFNSKEKQGTYYDID